ncbi:hypothetical protein CYR32_13025 [Chimaeribacter coloradensis]|uniref:Uncharacterized protein n=1 Tax=Chimaeribacter coloradensis TaxID=2060068 RepID=A0A2N5E1C4_9GAMM|nr:hypothetical protein [Chimaeribacter coloradensis]PLR34125.1 hypothetical protein CYR32_13025 [Chimaeribacter coloradensis]
MSDYREIALRIAEIIISPDSVVGFMQGALSVPVDIGYMVYGYFDTESHYAHDRERVRIAQALRKGILNHDRIADAVQIIFNEFTEQVTETEKNKIYSRAIFSLVGRIAANSKLASILATAILGKIAFYKKGVWALGGNILLIGGMTERSIRASEKLSIEEPEIYQLLRPMDYDLLYFLLEPMLKPFIDALSVKRRQGTYAFNKILMVVEEELGSYRG